VNVLESELGSGHKHAAQFISSFAVSYMSRRHQARRLRLVSHGTKALIIRLASFISKSDAYQPLLPTVVCPRV
ncbi:MAG: hypothetical protein AAF709_09335, partial [Pseudomonadota bacterium]